MSGSTEQLISMLIFRNEFAALAKQYAKADLGQGFPDEPAPKFVADELKFVASHPEVIDWHQYTRGYGHPRLIQALATLYTQTLGTKVDPFENVIVTIGADQALFYAFLGWLNEGDEVILFQPAYDIYSGQVKIAGGVPVPVSLHLAPKAESSADYFFDAQEIEKSITDKTKIIVLNNPHNPTGKLFTISELKTIADIAERHNLIVVTDEVYEWHVYHGHNMIRFG